MPDNLAGWCYVLEHPAWAKIGLVKIGMMTNKAKDAIVARQQAAKRQDRN